MRLLSDTLTPRVWGSGFKPGTGSRAGRRPITIVATGDVEAVSGAAMACLEGTQV